MKKAVFSIFMSLAGVFFLMAGSITNSKHNLSCSGPGSVKSDETANICIFCHTTHSTKSFAAKWNQGEGAVKYSLYSSSTLYSVIGQPDGASKLCLSCHDGTISLVGAAGGDSAPQAILPGRFPVEKKTNLGLDLADDHPISFDPTLAVANIAELKHPEPADKVRYDGNHKMQCTTCHDPHNNDQGLFFVKNNYNSDICKTCHVITGYNGISAHDIISNTWNGIGSDPWPSSFYKTVKANSCENCHQQHSAGGKERLLRSASEEDVCLACHNGNIGSNIHADLLKPSSHQSSIYLGLHQPREDMKSAQKHVECVDCHNPHRLNTTSAPAPYANGRLSGVSGMAITGEAVNPAAYEYEVCLKCHGDDRYYVSTTAKRQTDTSNIRTAISPSNMSFHPMAAPGQNSRVFSLKPPNTSSSRIYCTNCHGSDSSKSAGGAGPNGPHGSNYEYILERKYSHLDYTSYSANEYSLCFKCHDETVITQNAASGFTEHNRHVVKGKTPCFVCHDPHGVPGNKALINFDTNIVFPNDSGQLRFEVIGSRGYCYLNCHGKEHDPKEYGR
jgi:predicted CXXCH cytochrome family protein